MANVSITAKQSIVDLAGNPMVQAVVDNSQTVTPVNPSTEGAPKVSDPTITDTDDGKKLDVSFTFSEAMDTGIAPTVTFDPAVASTLTGQSGEWQSDGKTYKVQATIDDKGIDANEVTIDITGAKDVAGNLQVDHTAVKGLEVDTANPDKSTISIVVVRTMIRQTAMQRPRSLFRPRMLIQARSMLICAVASTPSLPRSTLLIKDVTDTIGTAAAGGNAATGLKKAQSDAAALEKTTERCPDCVTRFGSSGSSGFADSGAVNTEIGLSTLQSNGAALEKTLSDAKGVKSAFFAADPAGPSAGFADSGAIGNEAKRLEDLAE